MEQIRGSSQGELLEMKISGLGAVGPGDKISPFPSPGDLPHRGTEPGSPALQADSLPTEPPGKEKFSTLGTNGGETSNSTHQLG